MKPHKIFFKPLWISKQTALFTESIFQEGFDPNVTVCAVLANKKKNWNLSRIFREIMEVWLWKHEDWLSSQESPYEDALFRNPIDIAKWASKKITNFVLSSKSAIIKYLQDFVNYHKKLEPFESNVGKLYIIYFSLLTGKYLCQATSDDIWCM